MLLPCATCTTEVAEISHDDYAAGRMPMCPQCAHKREIEEAKKEWDKEVTYEDLEELSDEYWDSIYEKEFSDD